MKASDKFILNCRGHLLDLSVPAVMGIININDDSFYAESRSKHLHQVLDKAAAHLEAGAAILDLGAQSTRPGAEDIGEQAELEHLLPAIHAILHRFPTAILSVDTFRATVAEKVLQAGAAIINDISAGDMDPDMIHVVSSHQAPYIAMHMQGTPATMQQNPTYDNVVLEVLDYFIRKKEQCRLAGINDVIIDPGFGFGKTMAHNYALLKHLSTFHILDCPLLAGVSRKSMIWRLLNTDAAHALNGTTVVHTIALQQGAQLLRVHDVNEAMQAIRILGFMQAQEVSTFMNA